LKILSQQKNGEKLAILTKNAAILCKKKLPWHCCSFNRKYFRRKLVKIAENCDHNIGPWWFNSKTVVNRFSAKSFRLLHKWRETTVARVNQSFRYRGKIYWPHFFYFAFFIILNVVPQMLIVELLVARSEESERKTFFNSGISRK
jgi:hypothetical protein